LIKYGPVICWAVFLCVSDIISAVTPEKFDKAASDAIAQTVADIEKQSNAEVVVVVRGRSGTYRHADYLFGAIVALVALILILFLPWEFHTYWIPFDVFALFIAGAWISSRGDFLRRLLTTETFQTKAARTGAAAMFYEAGIANTSAENGVLIYLSILERQLEIIADRGILTSVPPLEWNHAVYEMKESATRPTPAMLIDSLQSLGKLLAEHVPATGENPNELADGPRIELK
jgi:putative membrane protein